MLAPSHHRAAGKLSRESAEDDRSARPIGAQLREKRFEVGMGLRELARRLDVSPSLVSQVETGRIQPSERTLHAIVSELERSHEEIVGLLVAAQAAALEAPQSRPGPAAVDAERSGAAQVHRADRDRAVELGAGVRRQRMTVWERPDLEFMIVAYGPGATSSANGKLERERGREFGLVLSGTLDVTVGFEHHVLSVGDSISFQSTMPHLLRNDGEVEVRAIWVTLGRGGTV